MRFKPNPVDDDAFRQPWSRCAACPSPIGVVDRLADCGPVLRVHPRHQRQLVVVVRVALHLRRAYELATEACPTPRPSPRRASRPCWAHGAAGLLFKFNPTPKAPAHPSLRPQPERGEARPRAPTPPSALRMHIPLALLESRSSMLLEKHPAAMPCETRAKIRWAALPCAVDDPRCPPGLCQRRSGFQSHTHTHTPPCPKCPRQRPAAGTQQLRTGPAIAYVIAFTLRACHGAVPLCCATTRVRVLTTPAPTRLWPAGQTKLQ